MHSPASYRRVFCFALGEGLLGSHRWLPGARGARAEWRRASLRGMEVGMGAGLVGATGARAGFHTGISARSGFHTGVSARRTGLATVGAAAGFGWGIATVGITAEGITAFASSLSRRRLSSAI